MVKLLDEQRLVEVNSMLNYFDTGGPAVIEGSVQLYSCKLAGDSKALSKSLDQQYIKEIAAGTSAGSFADSPFSTSPVGPLTAPESRKTLINLILVLNATFPDYDFSSLRPEDFTKEETLQAVATRINRDLCKGQNVGRDGGLAGKSVQDELVQRLWGAVDATILPEECNIYSYHSETDGDPLSGEGKIWAFNYFFCNKKLKRILYITAESLDDEDLGLHSDEEDDRGIFGEDMDMEMD